MIRFFAALAVTMVLGGAVAAEESQPFLRNASPEALELTEVTRAGDLIRLSIESQESTFKQLVANSLPSLARADLDRIWAYFVDELNNSLPELLNELALIYDDSFTTPELTGLVAFYRSPLGQKLTASQAAIQQRFSVIGQEFGERAGARAMLRFQQENATVRSISEE